MKKNVMKRNPVLIKCAIALVALFGCMKSSNFNYSATINNINNINSKSFDFIGVEHNRGLDYVFSNTLQNNNPTFVDVLKSVDKYVFEVSPITSASKDNRDELFNSETRALLKSSITSRSIIIDRTALIKKLTPAQFSMIEKLDGAFSLPDVKLQLSEIKSLKEEAINTLNNEEIVFVLSTLSLAEYSLTYWSSSKGEIWKDRIMQISNSRSTYLHSKANSANVHLEIKANKINWHNIAAVDVAAFIAGFPAGINVGVIVGGLTVGIATGGIGAGVGAVLGGVVGGSASGIAAAIGASSLVLASELIVDWF
jgi:hypothetical protein